MDQFEKDLELRKFYCEQRDKHVQQLMSVSGQGTFATLAVVASLLIGVFGIKKNELEFKVEEYTCWLITFLVGIVFLFLSTGMYSFFHTERIRRFEELIQKPVPFAKLKANEFEIIPSRIANVFIFLGLVLMLIGVFGTLYSFLNSKT